MTDTVKILEWNINMRTTNRSTPSWLGDVILAKAPDIIVLVEYKADHQQPQQFEEELSDQFWLRKYNGARDSTNQNRFGNGILIGLRKALFKEPDESEVTWQADNIAEQPNWLAIDAQLLNGQRIKIVGVRVRVGSGYIKKDLIARKAQLKWLFDTQNATKQIIIGDVNYGPHRDEYKAELALNWPDIIKLAQTAWQSPDLQPYSPQGTSWKNRTLDWIFTNGVQVQQTSPYNALDWSFGNHNTQPYLDGYLVPDGYFICSDPSNPDHAIFTVEVAIH